MSTTTNPAPAAREAAETACAGIARLHQQVARAVRGKDDVIESAVACILAGGHILVEDLPGMGKTTLAYALARAMDVNFSRIQFTSDLLPADVLGVPVYDDRLREFVFKRGPVFAQIVLADEINRATPKTQSALLEVMDRAKVSVDGQVHEIEPPFVVIATQNPVDYESTFPLPDSQMDRFLMRLRMGYPPEEEELSIVADTTQGYDALPVEAVATRHDLLQWRECARQIYVEESLLRFLVAVVRETRVEETFRAGVSTRGAKAWRAAAQALALIRGRDYVSPKDLLDAAVPVLAHRLSLKHAGADPLADHDAVARTLTAIVDRAGLPV